MYPNVSLKIKNHIPKIIYYPEEGLEKTLTFQNESIYEVVVPIAKKLNLINRELIENDPEILAELFDLARQSDELYVTDLPEIEFESLEFDLNKVLNNLLNDIQEEQLSEYEGIDVSQELKDELNKNINADIFASLLEVMYMTLIAKTLVAASDLGIGTIKLDDKGKNARLMEKMAVELEKLEVDMIVDPEDYEIEDIEQIVE